MFKFLIKQQLINRPGAKVTPIKNRLALGRALLLICVSLNATQALGYTGDGGYYDFALSPQSCFTRSSFDQGFLKRNRGSIANHSRRKTIQVVCPLIANFKPSPNVPCSVSGGTASYNYSIEFTIRLRPQWSAERAQVQFIKVSPKLTDNPAFYRVVDNSPAATDPSRWDGTSRYWSWSRSIDIFCSQTTATGASKNIDTWSSQAIVSLPPGAQLSQLVSFGGRDN